MSPIQKKQLLRKLYKVYNTDFLSKKRLVKTEINSITQLLKQYFNHTQTKRILIYKSFLSEIPILSICQKLSSLSNVAFFYPDTVNYSIKAKQFEYLQYSEVKSHHSLESIDFVITPGLFVDQDGTRLGRGGGYYDRILHHWPLNQRMFVGFSWQQFNDSFWRHSIIQEELNKSCFNQIDRLDLFSRLPKESHDQQIGYFNNQFLDI